MKCYYLKKLRNKITLHQTGKGNTAIYEVKIDGYYHYGTNNYKVAIEVRRNCILRELQNIKPQYSIR